MLISISYFNEILPSLSHSSTSGLIDHLKLYSRYNCIPHQKVYKLHRPENTATLVAARAGSLSALLALAPSDPAPSVLAPSALAPSALAPSALWHRQLSGTAGSD